MIAAMRKSEPLSLGMLNKEIIRTGVPCDWNPNITNSCQASKPRKQRPPTAATTERKLHNFNNLKFFVHEDNFEDKCIVLIQLKAGQQLRIGKKENF